MRTTAHSPLSNLKATIAMTPFALWKLIGIASVFCVATAIASPAQTFTTLANFDITNGANPYSPVVQGTDGNFYGTTNTGGYLGLFGTVFKITPGGTLTTVYEFGGGGDGSGPTTGLVLASDGNFYGTTTGGTTGAGTVFKMTPGGTLTTLYNFCSQPHCTDGSDPNGTLVQAIDGNFYGTTYGGGPYLGTIFKITPAGALTTLYRFCSQPNCADGAYVSHGLVQATDGNLYGTTIAGGAGGNCGDGCGTVFKITPGGALTTLHNFTGTDGSAPIGALMQATDGNFYGTAGAGGASDNCANPVGDGCGTIFKITPGGTLTTLYNFCSQPNCTDGFDVFAPLIQGTDGSFYGTTYTGGANDICPAQFTSIGCGTVFRLSTGLSPFVEIQPSIGQVGTPVTILGTNLSGATNVLFNGTAATFNVVSASEITTTVPAGATTGTVQVTLPGTTVISNTDFQVVGPVQFVPVMPCRLIDTRQTGGPIQGGTSRSFTVPQLGNCGIPSGAAAYSLNVTVSPHGALGYLTIWPNREIQPYVSTMNSLDGRIKANAAIVPSGNNAVSVYASDTTDVILDVDGYFGAPSSQTFQFYPLPPCRIVDTRNHQDGGTLLAGMERDYNIAGQCGVPNTATAYSLNVTVLPAAGGLDYLTVWPKGETKPYVSTLNDPTGTIVANAAIVLAGSENATAFYPNSNNTDLLVDVDGYFAAPGADGLSLYAVAPCRVLDTRNSGNGFVGTMTVNVEGSPCAPPTSAKAYVFNATVVPPGPMLYLTLWPHGESQPTVSTLNAQDGAITSNLAIVPTNDGSIDAYAYALTQLILDISGYFAP